MKYEVLKDGMAKDGRRFSCGAIVELDSEYAQHLVGRKIVKAVSEKKTKYRATVKPNDLEQAVEEE